METDAVRNLGPCKKRQHKQNQDNMTSICHWKQTRT